MADDESPDKRIQGHTGEVGSLGSLSWCDLRPREANLNTLRGLALGPFGRWRALGGCLLAVGTRAFVFKF